MIDRWLSAFAADPQTAVNDLFSGRAGLGSGMRLDVPEILYQEFPAVPELQDARQKLDAALFAWFAAMRNEYSRQISRLGFGVYSKRLCDCLIAVQLLNLPMFPYQLRQGLDSWLRWLAPLRLAPECDPRLECWRLIARHQEDAGHTAAWLRLAGDTRSEYLAVALLGLQGCPNDAQSNQVLMLTALLLHESACWPSGAEANAHFKRRYAALRGLGPYPRGPQHWQQNLEAALTVFQHLGKNKTAKELHQILSEKSEKQAARSKPKGNIYPVSTAEREFFQKDLESGSQKDAAALAERFFTNQQKNLRFAEQTGNSYFFARTLSNQGGLLLKRYALSHEVMRRLERLIEQGLAWEPYNPFVWMLWADWHKARKQFRQREWILREMVRLFPDDEPSRVELARLLISRGEAHWDEAEKWLREAAERNPKKEPCRVELARLLISRGEAHWDEAEHWLREVADRHPNNEPSRVELARLLINRGEEHWDEAEKLLLEVINYHSNNGQAHQVLASLLAKKKQLPEAIRLLEEFIAHTGGNPHILGFLERLRGGHAPEADEVLSPPDAIEMEAAAPESAETFGNHAADDSRRKDTAHPASQQRGIALVMKEIEHRASLQIEFQRILAGETADSELLLRCAGQGDTLAGFFQQWLNRDSSLEVPPNAWAWRACALYQRQASLEEWRELEETCADKITCTRFIRLQAAEQPDEALRRDFDQRAARIEQDENWLPVEKYIAAEHRRADRTPEQRQAAVRAVFDALAAEPVQLAA